METEGLKTEEGITINVAHFLAYLAHGPLASRFRGMDEVLQALGNPRSFGGHDVLSVRAVVRSAKSWTPRAQVTAPSGAASHAASGFVPGGSREIQLMGLFQAMFTVQELETFINYVFGRRVTDEIAWNGTLSAVSWNVQESLRRRGLVSLKFFLELLIERPNWTSQIRQVAQAWDFSI